MADQYRDRPFPADDDHGYDAQARPAASDPLAELARLIGQADPFSKYNRAGQPPQPSDHYDAGEDGGYEDEPAQQPTQQPSWMRNRAPAQEASYGDDHSFAQRHHDDHYGDRDQQPRFEPQPFEQDHQRGASASRYDDVLFGQPDRDLHRDTPFPAHNDRYSDDGYGRPRYDEDHDDEMPAPRRGGTVTVVVVLLLAVVGTAAAFGYRTFIGSPRSGEPPVIKADAGPNKVMSASSGDKQITDRIGDKSAERVVSREEQPLDVNGKAQPRVVFPPLSQNTNPPTAASANTAVRPTGAGVGNGTVTGGGEEPKKIRTLTIRPDQPDATASSAPSAPTTAPAAPARSAPAAPRASVAPTPTAGGPIALTPQATTAAPEAKPRVASVSTPPAGGGAYVQVSSQKTEADAQTSFRAIQSKYADVLGSKPSTIRRADLGEKGVFYRALVGPFGTTDEAATFCVNLKAAGGQCIVQRN